MAPVELARRPQWVAWELVPRPGEPKPTKVPINARTGRHASTTNPSTWGVFEEAGAFVTHHPNWHCTHPDCAGISLGLQGIGYVLSADDPYVGIDLDKCRDPETGKVEEWARDVIKRLSSYTEVSPSGTGLRIFVRGELPSRGRRKGQIEIYSQARFLTITGQALAGLPKEIQDRSSELLAWHTEVFGQPSERTNGHSPGIRVPINLADGDLLLKARNAENGPRFWALWNGDYSGYDSESEATLALLNMLAFWTGPDAARLDALFRSSGMMRDKWDERRGSATWGALQIDKALMDRTEFYSGGSTSHLEISAGQRIIDPQTGEVTELSPWQSLAELTSIVADPVKELMQGILWTRRTHWAYSAPSAGKTLFLVAAMMHIAAGKPFCGRNVVQGPVLLIEEDSPLSILSEYVGMLADIYDLDLATLPFWVNRAQGFRIVSDEHLIEVFKMIQSAPQLPIILGLDACERLVPSERFSSKELDPLARLLQKTMSLGMTNVVIDHTRKSQAQQTQQDPLDLLYGGRTKSAISDVMMFFSGSIRSSARVTFTKFRGATPSSFDVSFDAASGFALKSRLRELSENERLAMRVLNNSRQPWTTKAEIVEGSGLGERTVERALTGLMQAGWVVRDEAHHPARYKPDLNAPGMFG